MIYLVRHGATEWAKNGRHTGRSDIPLTEDGREQAEQFIPVFQEVEFAQVWTSPLQRAMETAKLAGLGERAEILEDLHEWDYGDYEGITTVEIQKTVPDWNVFTHGCPNGEKVEDVAVRARHVIERCQEVEGNVALFSHGHFLRVLGCCWAEIEPVYGRHLLLGTSTLSILATDRGTPVIRTWNGPLLTAACAYPWRHPHS